MKKELLSPAGDIEAGYAAIHYGANAVYLGLKNFSARASVANFDESELNEFTGYAHSKKVRVFVALNTLVLENELDMLLKNLDICRRCKVDAVILQDLGVARIVREKYPDIEMHASTQMAVHNKEGALELKKLGFKRVVLARELSLEETKAIAAIEDLETEVFVHGALCYSFSGLCLLSSSEGNGSANRGKCSSPCRALYKSKEGEKHYFSMKDLALGEEVMKLPVTSLKIEGRKKSPLYVAAVTDYYRNILDGKGSDYKKEENLKQIFSRPWSKFNFKSKDKSVVDTEFVGHRGILIGKVEQIIKGKIVFHTKRPFSLRDGIQIEVSGQEKPFGFSAQYMTVNGQSVFEVKEKDEVSLKLPAKTVKIDKGQKIFLASSGLVKNSYNYYKPKEGVYKSKPKFAVLVEIFNNKISANLQGTILEANDSFLPAENPEKVNAAIKTSFMKTGDCEFEVAEVKIHNPHNLFVPVSRLNELRRNLYSQIVLKYDREILPEIDNSIEHNPKGWIVKIDDIKVLSEVDFADFAEIIYVLKPNTKIEELKTLPKNKLRFALPAICRDVEGYLPLINKLISSGYKKWEVANFWGVAILPQRGIDLSFDSSIYMLNSQAIQTAKEIGATRITLSVEDNRENVEDLLSKSMLPVVLVVYQDTELFNSAVCIRENPCHKCDKKRIELKLSKNGNSYTALLENCRTILISDNTYCIAKQAHNIQADFYRVDFMNKKYSSAEVKKIWLKLKSFENTDNSKTANFVDNRSF